MTQPSPFAAYNAARERDSNGYDYKGHILREHNPAWSPFWTVSKSGAFPASFRNRTEACAYADLLT